MWRFTWSLWLNVYWTQNLDALNFWDSIDCAMNEDLSDLLGRQTTSRFLKRTTGITTAPKVLS